jgi:FAD/FMN-containing dehydrogenase
LHFPIDLGADPSIGGMVATNTGGSRLLRYGDVRQNVLGLQVVLMDAEATLIDLNQALRKNNTGLDLKQLFIGSQGTMGCVTEATLRLWPLPAQRATALIGLAEPADALRLFQAVGHRFADFCTAFEGISAHAMSAALAHVPSLSHPFPDGLPAYAVLLELSSSLPASENFKLEEHLVDFLSGQDDLSMLDAVIGRGEDLWAIRHALSEGLRSAGHVIALDISMPLRNVFQFRAQALAWLRKHYPTIVVCDFGHIGDGGLHFNMSWPWGAGEPTPAQIRDIRTTLYDLVVQRYAGSFSAEHGIGPYNQDFYDRYTPVFQKGLIGVIKKTLDPLSLLGRARLGLELPPA